MDGGREWGERERETNRQTETERDQIRTRTLSYSGIVALAPKDLSDS